MSATLHGRDDAEMRAFLLGTLGEDRRAALEQRVFDDEEAYDALMDAQYDLLDEYARGELSQAERGQVEGRLLSTVSEEALDLTRILASRRSGSGVHDGEGSASRTRLRSWLPTLAAAAAALVAVSTSVWLAVDNRRLRAEIDAARSASRASLPDPRPPAVEPKVARLVLSSRTTRSDVVPSAANLPADVSMVEFVLPVDETFPHYQVALEGRDGRLWFQRVALRAADGAVHVWIPAPVLGDGLYEVLVFGGQGDPPPLVAAYPARIQREKPPAAAPSSPDGRPRP